MLLIEPKQLCNVFRNVFGELELYGEREILPLLQHEGKSEIPHCCYTVRHWSRSKVLGGALTLPPILIISGVSVLSVTFHVLGEK